MTDRAEAVESKIAGNTGESSTIVPSGMEMSQFSSIREQMTRDQSASILPSLKITGLESQETSGTIGDTSPSSGTMSDGAQSVTGEAAQSVRGETEQTAKAEEGQTAKPDHVGQSAPAEDDAQSARNKDIDQSARDDGGSKVLEGQAPGSEAPNPPDNGSATQGAASNEGNMGSDATEPPMAGSDDAVPPTADDSAAMQTIQDHVNSQENEMKLPENFHQPTQQFDNQQIPGPFESNGFGGTPESL